MGNQIAVPGSRHLQEIIGIEIADKDLVWRITHGFVEGPRVAEDGGQKRRVLF
jgi:hypothetical protein